MSQSAPKEFPGNTKINQLPDQTKAELFAVERHLRDQRSKFNMLWSQRNDVDTNLQSVSSRTETITRGVSKLHAEVDAMRTSIDALRSAVATERSSAEPIFTAFDNFCKTTLATSSVFSTSADVFPMHDGRLTRAAHVPEEYFQRVVADLEARAHSYKAEIDEIAEFLRAQGVSLGNPSISSFARSRGPHGIHPSSVRKSFDITTEKSGVGPESYGKTIEDIIRRQYEYFMTVASQIATVNEQLRSVKEAFLGMLAAKDGDMVINPFEQADLREKADKDRHDLLVERTAPGDQMVNPHIGVVSQSQNASLATPAQISNGPGNVVLTTGALTVPKSNNSSKSRIRTSFDGGQNKRSDFSGRRMSEGRRKT